MAEESQPSDLAKEILSTKVSPYYMRKMHTFFHCKNHHTKGVVTKMDYELQSDRFQKLANISTLREQQARRKLLAIWESYFGEVAKSTPITPDVFAKCIAYKGKEKLLAVGSHYGDILFDLIDVNGDGKIQPAEFVLFHKLYLLNEETADAAFKQLDEDNKGYVDYESFIEAVTKFFQPDDEDETVLYGPLVD